jgi:hypothetical protein
MKVGAAPPGILDQEMEQAVAFGGMEHAENEDEPHSPQMQKLTQRARFHTPVGLFSNNNDDNNYNDTDELRQRTRALTSPAYEITGEGSAGKRLRLSREHTLADKTPTPIVRLDRSEGKKDQEV